jgi:hypothetical protein
MKLLFLRLVLILGALSHDVLHTGKQSEEKKKLTFNPPSVPVVIGSRRSRSLPNHSLLSIFPFVDTPLCILQEGFAESVLQICKLTATG